MIDMDKELFPMSEKNQMRFVIFLLAVACFLFGIDVGKMHEGRKTMKEIDKMLQESKKQLKQSEMIIKECERLKND